MNGNKLSNTMNLPQDLQHFPHAALIIASDSMHAKFFLVGGDTLQELDGVALPREFRQDSEGAFTSSDGSRVAGPDSDIDDTPRLHHFVKQVAEQANLLCGKHEIAHVHLVMPAEIEHLFSSECAAILKEKIRFILHADLMKEHPLEIVRRVLVENI